MNRFLSAVVDRHAHGERAAIECSLEQQFAGQRLFDDRHARDVPGVRELVGPFVLQLFQVGKLGRNFERRSSVPGRGRMQNEGRLGDCLLNSDRDVFGLHFALVHRFELERDLLVGCHTTGGIGKREAIAGDDRGLAWLLLAALGVWLDYPIDLACCLRGR